MICGHQLTDEGDVCMQAHGHKGEHRGYYEIERGVDESTVPDEEGGEG